MMIRPTLPDTPNYTTLRGTIGEQQNQDVEFHVDDGSEGEK